MADSAIPTGTIGFAQWHQPALRDGGYTVHVAQEVAHPDKITADRRFETKTMRFRVAGERFRLNPLDVHAVFPPDGGRGDHAMVLPHVVLLRSTLPWERDANRNDPATPWLALLAFDEDEIGQVVQHDVPFGRLAPTGEADPRFPALPPEQEVGDEPVTVIDVPWSLLSTLLPTREELRLQAHVRHTRDAGAALDGPEYAVVIGNRLGRPGKTTTVHLVSMESWLADDPGAALSVPVQPADTVRLITLKRWRYMCDADAGAFAKKVEGLNVEPPYLRMAGDDDPAMPVLDAGGVPVAHTLRDGGRTVSIYRGPLAATAYADAKVGDPVAAADPLLVYDPKTGLFDASHAAAWELGRLLTLRNGRVATELYQWKRMRAQRRHRALQVLAHPHLPGHQRDVAGAAPPPLADVVQSWFDDLRLLKGLPFHYLVPHESMLPVESMRFFRVDASWLAALLDGAYSIGRVSAADHEADRERVTAVAPPATPVSGVLLRSAVVSGWPDLLIDGYDSAIAGAQPHPAGQLKLLRLERLGADMMLALFDGAAQTVDVHVKPETLHFGVDMDENAQTPSYFKHLRNTLGDDSAARVDIPWGTGGQASRRIDMAAFARRVQAALAANGTAPADAEMTSALFALEMIEGVQKVRFTVA